MLNKATHRIHLIQILNYIYKNSKLSSVLGFKGGTAAYLFYNLPRFSTDLSFDLISSNVDIDELQKQIDSYVRKNYQILDQWDKKYTVLWKLSYEKDTVNIKIEVSKRDASMYTYEPQNLYGNTISVIKPGQLIVQKFLALRNRPVLANRDIFDINYFLKSKFATEIDYEVLGSVTQMEPKVFLKELRDYLIKNKPKKILDGLGEVVDEDIKSWIREELFDETLNLIDMQIDSL